ncbi:MAG: hypothetical protein IJ356_02930 [Erysipelotrichaceae bacterium]|nr:hypothetical protein [Erysipelotrichaceae bacterium]
MNFYFPSCHFKILFPKESNIIQKKFSHFVQLECCRERLHHLKRDDLAVFICTNCNLILKENVCARVISIFEWILNDNEYVYPNLSGRTLIIQHCGKADEYHRRTVEKILIKMGAIIKISSIDDYCGYQLMQPISEKNLKAAPEVFSKLNERIEVLDMKLQEERIQSIVEAYSGKTVVTYCNSCYQVLNQHGVNVYHLAQLLFNDNYV